jgi:hypothetical protein
MVHALHESESELLPAEVDTAIERCRAEIAAIEAQIRNGHPDLQGLCLALSDWNCKMKLCGGTDPSRVFPIVVALLCRRWRKP